MQDGKPETTRREPKRRTTKAWGGFADGGGAKGVRGRAAYRDSVGGRRLVTDKIRTTAPWRPIETVPSTGMVIVRGADGIERQYSGGWIEGKNSPPVVPKEWRYMIEEVDL